MEALSFLQAIDARSLALLFWFTILFEIPRYAIGALVVPVARLWRSPPPPGGTDFTISVVVAGHNEAEHLRRCVEGLAEQTVAARLSQMEVILIDDGSTDRTFEVARGLRDEGKIDKILRVAQRGGKSAAVNLGLAMAKGEIVIICDVDSSFDRDAFAELIRHFADPRVGAVSGNIGVRNADLNLITRHQAIEYAITISLGRSIQEALGVLSIVSGAFGAFRRTAIEQVGRQDVEVGEDADLTMKLRRAGWLIRFAPDAHALTDVPTSVSRFIAQRLRWDSGIVRIWLRKFRGAFDFRQSTFPLTDVAASLDVLLFQFLLPLAFPAYIVWLAHQFGSFAWVVIAATLFVYFVLALLSYLAAAVIGIRAPLGLLLYIPFYTIVQTSLMRVIRIVALAQELIFRSSYRDTFVPSRVMRQVEAS